MYLLESSTLPFPLGLFYLDVPNRLSLSNVSMLHVHALTSEAGSDFFHLVTAVVSTTGATPSSLAQDGQPSSNFTMTSPLDNFCSNAPRRKTCCTCVHASSQQPPTLPSAAEVSPLLFSQWEQWWVDSGERPSPPSRPHGSSLAIGHLGLRGCGSVRKAIFARAR